MYEDEEAFVDFTLLANDADDTICVALVLKTPEAVEAGQLSALPLGTAGEAISALMIKMTMMAQACKTIHADMVENPDIGVTEALQRHEIRLKSSFN
jgi:hypothetical protein